MLHIQEVFHPTDCSPESLEAFYHALAIAERVGATLNIMHVAGDGEEFKWSRFPQVRETLEQWKLRPSDDSDTDPSEKQLHVKKILAQSKDPVDAILRFLKTSYSDLIVIGTHQYHGVRALLHRGVSQPLLRRSQRMMLILPPGSAGFVEPSDGSTAITHVLIPVVQDPDPQNAIDVVTSLLTQIQPGHPVTLHLLHIGETFPDYSQPPPPFETREILIHGAIEKSILEQAIATNADLILLISKGRESYLDSFFGSTAEQITRHATVPVLVVPNEYYPE